VLLPKTTAKSVTTTTRAAPGAAAVHGILLTHRS
jgi:hypothetical protein